MVSGLFPIQLRNTECILGIAYGFSYLTHLWTQKNLGLSLLDVLRSAVFNSTDLGAITLVTRASALVRPHVFFLAMARFSVKLSITTYRVSHRSILTYCDDVIHDVIAI